MTTENPLETGVQPAEIVWRAHPLVENIRKSVLLLVIFIATFFGVWSWTALSIAVIGIVLLTVAMAPYIFPTNYRLDRDGIEIKFFGIKTRRAWEEYRNFYPHEMGVHLSTFKKPSALDAFRGNFILFNRDAENREEVLAYLGSHIDRPEPVKEERTDQ